MKQFESAKENPCVSTKEDVEEIFGIRSTIESYAAYLATLHIVPEKISLLERKVNETEKKWKRRFVS